MAREQSIDQEVRQAVEAFNVLTRRPWSGGSPSPQPVFHQPLSPEALTEISANVGAHRITGGRPGNALIRVALVAPQLTCFSLEHLISTAVSLEVVARAHSMTQWEQLTAASRSADVLVLDTDHCATLQDVKQLLVQRPVRVVVLTGLRDTTAFDPLIAGGLQGIVRKHDAPSSLARAIEHVQHGELWLDRGAMSRVIRQVSEPGAIQLQNPTIDHHGILTQRERQTVAALVAFADAPYKVIADHMAISDCTLRNRLTSIYRKLNLRSRVALYAYAMQHRLHEPD